MILVIINEIYYKNKFENFDCHKWFRVLMNSIALKMPVATLAILQAVYLIVEV
jgi:hypothetical protein